MNARQLTKKLFPNASDDMLEHIIWGMTGFPGFWRTTKKLNTPLKCFVHQLYQAKKAIDAHQYICICCGKILPKEYMNKFRDMCKPCTEKWRNREK